MIDVITSYFCFPAKCIKIVRFKGTCRTFIMMENINMLIVQNSESLERCCVGLSMNV